MLIKDIFNLSPKDGDVAFEIELEGMKLPTIYNEIWDTKRDGSLRGGMDGQEYIFNQPLPITKVEEELEEFVAHFDPKYVADSFYAGTHLHVNVQDLTMRELLCYISAYLILENILVKWCGETREGNHFCLRTEDADYLVKLLRDMVLNDSSLNFDPDLRYSSMNIMSVSKFGSLEFRALNSSLDVERMMTWATVLHNIKKQAIIYKTPANLVSSVSNEGYEHFARNMLTEKYADLFLKGEWFKSVRKGILYAQDFAFAKDWNEINLNIFKKNFI